MHWRRPDDPAKPSSGCDWRSHGARPTRLAFAELGGQLSKLGRIEESFAMFESGIALTPGVTELLMGLGYLHLKTNNRAKARALFLQVQAADPGRLDALSALANVMALDGEYAAAADLYRRVLALGA